MTQGAGSGEVSLQERHLIGKHMMPLKVDILSVGWSEGYSQQLHSSLLRCSSRFVVIAADASGNDVIPAIGSLKH